MKRLFTLLLGLFVAVCAFCQQLDDVVYLKNGSIIHGIVIEQVPGESLKIQTSDGSVFVYKMADVEKITKEQTQANNNAGVSYDDELSVNTFFLSEPKLVVNGKTLTDREAVSLIGANRYNDFKKHASNRFVGSIFNDMGVSLLIWALIDGLLGTNNGKKGLIEGAIGTTFLIPGIVLTTTNDAKIKKIVDSYNIEKGYSYGFEDRGLDNLHIKQGLAEPNIPGIQYVPIFAYSINF